MRRAALAVSLALVASCYAPGTIRRVTFHAQAKGVDRDVALPFTTHTAAGWDVTLTTAQVSIGPVYLRNSSSAGGTESFDDAGRVVAEVRAHFTVDALDPTPHDVGVLGDGTTEGAVASEVRLYDAVDGPIADVAGMGIAVAHVAGTARAPDGHTVVFDGFLELPLASATAGYDWSLAHRVTNIDSMLLVEQDGTLTVVVDATHWLDAVDFGSPTFDPTLTSAPQTGQLKTGIGARDAFQVLWMPAP